MSDSKGPRVPPHRKPHDTAGRSAGTGMTGRYERGGLPRPASRATPARHSAITRNLQNYASYKLWAEKIKSSWEPGKDPKG